MAAAHLAAFGPESSTSNSSSKPVCPCAPNTDRLAMAGWSSLPGDLINRIADRFLDTDDLDYYMDLRAVCQSWRSATADPKNSPSDPRFQPRQWVMLDEVHKSDDARLFANAATGRFVRKDLQLLDKYDLIGGTSGGLVALAERSSPESPLAARLLYPFTGCLTRFKAPLPSEGLFVPHVIGCSLPTLVLLCVISGTIYWADPDSETFVACREHGYTDRLVRQALISAGTYAAAEHGTAPSLSLLAPEANRILGLVVKQFPDYFIDTEEQAEKCFFMVESAGEMLVVLKPPQGIVEVFGLDTGSNMLKPVKVIGSGALFVGNCRCHSVDADKFTSVEANTIYYVEGRMPPYNVRVYSLEDDTELLAAGDGAIGSSTCFSLNDSPTLSVVQLLGCYTAKSSDLTVISKVPQLAPNPQHPIPEFLKQALLSPPVHQILRSAMAIMADWSSLPADLINRIADRFLDTEDLDYYMDFRAVCQSWRSATADPKNSPSDPRFQPRNWVMLDEVHQNDARLFVNTATGRFVRKELPLPR
ncbi:hypothetical protein U9M48_014873 [Paspalum notatum var. saurae]|uniref:KIB1-4 beta-propeller domain-containing protein n=1 Tax=Paspalum notatum var. saurae TaxID=547442 RepID=A0AAQ3T3J7_PASNO